MTPDIKVPAAKNRLWVQTAGLGRTLLLVTAGVAFYVLCVSLGTDPATQSGINSSSPVEVFHGNGLSRAGLDFSFAEWNAIRSDPARLTDLAVVSYVPVHTLVRGRDAIVTAAFVSNEYFSASGLNYPGAPAFACAPDTSPAPCEEVVFNGQHQREIFGNAAPESILFNGHSLHSRGVLSPVKSAQRAYPSSPAVWIPLSAAPLVLGDNWQAAASNHYLGVVGRLPHTVDAAEASREIDRVLNPADERDTGGSVHTTVLPVRQAMLTHALRMTPRGAWFLTHYAPWLAFLLMVLAGSLAARSAMDSAHPPAHRRYLKAAALGLAGAALGGFGAVLLLKIVGAYAKIVNLPFDAPLPSVPALGIAFIGTTAAAIMGVAIDKRNKRQPARKWVPSSRDYLWVALTIVALIAVGSANGIFTGDFWEHSAAIRELAAHPFHPAHPIFHLDLPHQFFSPYALGLGLLSRLTGLSSIDSLRIAGVFNVGALLASFYLFSTRMFKREDTALYGILFLLFLWGPHALVHSGFIHFNSLLQVAPLPSTFVTALTFFVWYLALTLRNRQLSLFLALALLVPVALISHPLTSISMLIGIVVLAFDRDYPVRSRVAAGAAILAAFGAAAVWPLYPFFGLMGQSPRWHLDALWLYSDYPLVLLQMMPALIGIPVLVQRLRRDRRDFLGLTFLALLVVYIYGGLSGKYAYGRVVPFMIFMLQLSLADWLSRARLSSLPRVAALRTALLILLLFTGITMLPGLVACLPVWQDSYGEFKFLPSYVKPHDVVLADDWTSLKEPSFGGRVVAFSWGHTIGFVPDLYTRYDDRRLFFANSTSRDARRAILERYKVNFVLINRREVEDWPSVLRFAEQLGPIRYWNGDMVLIEVGQLSARDPKQAS